jgi:Kef-type K+ transport system membrane component KefB
MAFRAIHRNENVKKGWRVFSIVLYNSWYVFIVLRLLLRLRDRANKVYSTEAEIFDLVIFFFLLVYLITHIVYWIKPKLFLMNKEQSVQVCDATGTE